MHRLRVQLLLLLLSSALAEAEKRRRGDQDHAERRAEQDGGRSVRLVFMMRG